MGIGRAFRAGGVGALVAYVGEIRAQMPAALDAAALHRFAGVLGGEGRFADAVGVLQAAVQLFGTSVDGLGLLARARLTAGDQAGAVAAWRGVLDLQSDQEGAKAFLRQLDPATPPTGNAAFVLEGRPEARTVTLAGSFNGWDREHTFFRREAGRWTCRLQLPPGEYQYKIVVDGEEWMLDPGNPQTIDDGNGNTNSLIVIDQ